MSPKGINPDEAADILHQLLEAQKLVAVEAAAANQLKIEELAVERDKINLRSRELDLESQKIAIERETENRRNANLNEVVQRLVRQSERNDQLTNKLVTIDDSFGETVQRLIATDRAIVSALIDVEKALYALLTKNVDELQESKVAMPGSLRKLRIQELLLQHAETLHNLNLQVAGHGSLDAPPRLLNEVERIKAQITELEKGL